MVTVPSSFRRRGLSRGSGRRRANNREALWVRVCVRMRVRVRVRACVRVCECPCVCV